MAGVGRTTTRKSTGSYSITDPRKKTHTAKTASGGKVDLRSKTVADAKAGKGAYTPPVAYKGKEIRDSRGNLSGVKTHSGEYIRATDPVSSKRASKALAYDKKLQAHRASQKADRNKRTAEAKVKGS